MNTMPALLRWSSSVALLPLLLSLMTSCSTLRGTASPTTCVAPPSVSTQPREGPQWERGKAKTLNEQLALMLALTIEDRGQLDASNDDKQDIIEFYKQVCR